jgi:hypothetical protein
MASKLDLVCKNRMVKRKYRARRDGSGWAVEVVGDDGWCVLGCVAVGMTTRECYALLKGIVDGVIAK